MTNPPIDPEVFGVEESLPETLPDDPFPTVARWLEEATRRKVQPNPSAITLATADREGRPSARIVLCRDISTEKGYIVFYTNRKSRKGRELEANPRAAVIMHWDDLDRQVRLEGQVVISPDEESDAYFHARHPASRIGAWASDQSEPIASRDDLLAKVMQTMQELGVDLDNMGDATVPRPPHWGGYRIWAESVELWLGSPVRIHDRAIWTRTLTPNPGADHDAAFTASPWSATRLQP